MQVIGVVCENGHVAPRFGRAPQVRIYTVDDSKSVTEQQAFDVKASGHGARLDVLTDHGATVLICGGMGAPAAADAERRGIDVWSSIEGDADEAVAAFLSGQLFHIVVPHEPRA